MAVPDGVDRTVVVIGGGQGGVTLATTLRERGWTGRLIIVDSEPGAPYQRPPLSKGFLTGDQTHDDLVTRTDELLARDSIEYRGNTTVLRIDRDRREITLDSGTPLAYDILVIATGARARMLPLEGADADGVHVVRTREDAERLRTGLGKAADIVVLGGGFLGLELASAASHFGRVMVVESAPELLQRSLSPAVSRALAACHSSRGTTILLGTTVTRLLAANGRVTGVELGDGRVLDADLVIVSVGAQPNVELAVDAGLETANGISVTGSLRTSDSAIYAIGDCVSYTHPHVGGTVRLESVQNAVDQARHLAATLVGPEPDEYSATPWFWSHQAGQNLQIAGIAHPADDAVVAEEDEQRLTVARVRGDSLVAVETLNNPRVHIRARKLLAAGPVPADAIDELLSTARQAPVQEPSSPPKSESSGGGAAAYKIVLLFPSNSRLTFAELDAAWRALGDATPSHAGLVRHVHNRVQIDDNPIANAPSAPYVFADEFWFRSASDGIAHMSSDGFLRRWLEPRCALLNADPVVVAGAPRVLWERIGGQRDSAAKILVLPVRRSGTSPQEFVSHWTGAHASLALGGPRTRERLRRLENLPADAEAPQGLTRAPFDGVGAIQFDSLAAMEAEFSSDYYRDVLAPDELRFTDPQASAGMFVDGTLIFDRGA